MERVTEETLKEMILASPPLASLLFEDAMREKGWDTDPNFLNRERHDAFHDYLRRKVYVDRSSENQSGG